MSNYSKEANVTTITNQEVVTLSNCNKSALLSAMASKLRPHGLTPQVSLITAAAWVGACDHLDDSEMFFETFVDGLQSTELTVEGYVMVDDEPFKQDEIDGGLVLNALVEGRFFIKDGEEYAMGPAFGEMVNMHSEAYKPVLHEEGITRRFGYTPVNESKLAREAIHALEDSPYTVDKFMLSVAKQVEANRTEKDPEGYVLLGCELMDDTKAYISEFKGDRRVRLYQASCHGPNGQASDRSRSLMDLFGVPQDYNIEEVKQHIRAEMADMVTPTCPKARGQLVREALEDPVAFIIKHEAICDDKNADDIVGKPWSFVKAARIWKELARGNRPYIGMAVGLDAKCSGPQLGSLMVADQQIAAACGMSLSEVDDAYHLAVAACEKAGFHGLTRSLIKKPYMGIFYGQGVGAFLDPQTGTKDEMPAALWFSIHPTGMPDEHRAKAFHKAVESSFGQKMIAVRNAIRGMKLSDRVKHMMPDESEVAMNYRVKVNILNEEMDYDTTAYTVRLSNNIEHYKFLNYEMKTEAIHTGDFARNGFVNLIQAVDALIARLIIVHLKRLGAKHIISVHDCFRVNVTEVHLLEEAIKRAYNDLFGTEYNMRTEDMPLGTDILALYFEGANKACKEVNKVKPMSQYLSMGKRRLQKINGVKVKDIIEKLGISYFFAK